MRRTQLGAHWQYISLILIGLTLTLAASAWYLFYAVEVIRTLPGAMIKDKEGSTHFHNDKGNTHSSTSQDIHEVVSKLDRLIVVAHYKEKLDWTGYVNIPIKIIEKDNPRVPDNLNSRNFTEATSYLYYMINYYDNLADVMAFVHGHGEHLVVNDTIWTAKMYKPLPKPKTEVSCNTRHKLEGGNLVWLGHANDQPPASNNSAYESFTDQYIRAFHDLFDFLSLDYSKGGMGMKLPHYIETFCCSAFTIDRATIRRIPKDRLVRLYDYLESGINIDMGVTMEYVWMTLFNQASWR